jgi:hypothetical protein
MKKYALIFLGMVFGQMCATDQPKPLTEEELRNSEISNLLIYTQGMDKYLESPCGIALSDAEKQKYRTCQKQNDEKLIELLDERWKCGNANFKDRPDRVVYLDVLASLKTNRLEWDFYYYHGSPNRRLEGEFLRKLSLDPIVGQAFLKMYQGQGLKMHHGQGLKEYYQGQELLLRQREQDLKA